VTSKLEQSSWCFFLSDRKLKINVSSQYGLGEKYAFPYLDNRKNLTFETSKLAPRFAIMSHTSLLKITVPKSHGYKQ